jgi:hypothetical protein
MMAFLKSRSPRSGFLRKHDLYNFPFYIGAMKEKNASPAEISSGECALFLGRPA